MKEDFLSLVDGNLEQMGFSDRSAFIREAVREKLKESGVEVEKILTLPPNRAGKGGRKPKVIGMPPSTIPEPISKVAEDAGAPFKSPPAKATNYRKGLRKKME